MIHCHAIPVQQILEESAQWLVTDNAALSQTFHIAVARCIHPPWLTAHETHPVNYTELLNWQPFEMFCSVCVLCWFCLFSEGIVNQISLGFGELYRCSVTAGMGCSR